MKSSGAPRDKKPWPAYLSSFLINEMTGACKKRGLTISNCGIQPEKVAEIVLLNYEDHIDRKTAKAALENMLDSSAELRSFLSEIGGVIASMKLKPK